MKKLSLFIASLALGLGMVGAGIAAYSSSKYSDNGAIIHWKRRFPYKAVTTTSKLI